MAVEQFRNILRGDLYHELQEEQRVSCCLAEHAIVPEGRFCHLCQYLSGR